MIKEKNDIGEEGATSIFDALKTNTSLTKIDMCLLCFFSHNCFNAFCSKNKNSQARNKFKDVKTMKTLKEALSANTTLKKLTLG